MIQYGRNDFFVHLRLATWYKGLACSRGCESVCVGHSPPRLCSHYLIWHAHVATEIKCWLILTRILTEDHSLNDTWRESIDFRASGFEVGGCVDSMHPGFVR
jgi:hypothetical protein